MKTSRIVNTIFIACLFVFSAGITLCQTERLDIFEYTPPKGWAKTPKDGVMVYVGSNKTAGTFCILSVYPSTPTPVVRNWYGTVHSRNKDEEHMHW